MDNVQDITLYLDNISTIFNINNVELEKMSIFPKLLQFSS